VNWHRLAILLSLFISATALIIGLVFILKPHSAEDAPVEVLTLKHTWLWDPQSTAIGEWQCFNRPFKIEIGPYGELLVADSGNSRIIRFWESGEHEVLGRRGEGPGEFVSPVDLCVDIDRKLLWVTDSRLGRVLLFALHEHGTTFLNSYSSRMLLARSHPYLVPCLPDTSFYLLSNSLTSRISHIGKSGSLIKEFGGSWILDEDSRSRRNFGYLVTTDDDHLVFVGAIVPRIEKYTLAGELVASTPFREKEMLEWLADFEKQSKGDRIYTVAFSQVYSPNKSNNIYIMSDAWTIDIVNGDNLRPVGRLLLGPSDERVIASTFCVVENSQSSSFAVLYGIDNDTKGVVRFEPRDEQSAPGEREVPPA
jgi:hypothetical protein